MLTKTKTLFERERAKCKTWEADLRWLSKEKRRLVREQGRQARARQGARNR